MTPLNDPRNTEITKPVEVSQKDRLVGMVLVIISSVGISFGGLISRLLEDADAWQINIYRSLTTVIVALVVLLFRYRRSALGKLKKVGRPGIIGAGLLAIAGIAFLQALTTTTVANTLFTLAAIPFITAALAWVFLRESLSNVTIITMVGAAAGVGVMLVEGLGGGSIYGNVMALITAVGFSGYAVIIRRHRNIDMLPAYLLSAVMLLAISLLMRVGDWSVSWWDFWMCFIWGGILSGIGNILFITATRYLYAAEVTLFMLLEFALGPVWVWLFVNETPTIWTLSGGVLIMTAVIARTIYQVRVSHRITARGRLSGPG